MAVTSIDARCRHCRQDFHLSEVRDERRGTCPHCGSPLTPDRTDKLIHDATAADAALHHLVRALRSMNHLPGNVALRPHTVLRNLFEEVGWKHYLAQDPELLQEELCELRWLLVGWELLDPIVAAAQPHQTWRRRAVDWMTGRRPAPVIPTPANPDVRPTHHWPA